MDLSVLPTDSVQVSVGVENLNILIDSEMMKDALAFMRSQVVQTQQSHMLMQQAERLRQLETLMSEILNQLQEVKLAAQAQTEASQAQTTEWPIKWAKLTKHCNKPNKVLIWKEETKAVDIEGQGRYVKELFVDGDKDTFYPVYFLWIQRRNEIQIYRNYFWNRDNNDFNAHMWPRLWWC